MKKKLILVILLFFVFILPVSAKIESFDIQYNVNDPKGRCGNPSKNNCAQIAKVKYTSKTVTYYMQKQTDAEGLIVNSACRLHALTCVANALNNTTYSTLDLQNILKKYPPYDGNVYANNFENAFQFFKLDATRYHSDTSDSKLITLIKDSFKKDLPVIIFVRGYETCPDLATTNHALVLLGLDSNNQVVFLDSVARYQTARKRTIDELVKGCKVSKGVANGYYNLITLSSEDSLTGGSINDIDTDIEKPATNNNFTCHTIFLNSDGSETEFKQILDGIFNLIQVIAPIIAIVLTIIDYYKALTANVDIKKVNKRTMIRIIIATLIVFLPLLLNLLFHLFGLYDLSTCNIGE